MIKVESLYEAVSNKLLEYVLPETIRDDLDSSKVVMHAFSEIDIFVN